VRILDCLTTDSDESAFGAVVWSTFDVFATAHSRFNDLASAATFNLDVADHSVRSSRLADG